MEKWISDNGDGTFTNPILYTDYSDPDAIRVGENYFMIASSFCNTPGVPILHSRDLVNWKVINYALENIEMERYYEKPVHGCGVWAPAIRYRKGIYYIFIPMPDEGIFVTTAKDPWGKWSPLRCILKVKGWIDPCPFWDDDGKAYMVSAYARSRIGFKSIIHLCEIDPEHLNIIDNGKDIFDGNVNEQPTIEGPKLYKRNGYYYIFAPAGGVKPGWQTVLRSKNIWGPYEYRNVMLQGDTSVNGPHQGAWVDTVTGEDWFLHFQDVYAAGRIIHLQPMEWEDDWPVIGKREEGKNYGTPVDVCKKPDVGGVYPVVSPDVSDDFYGKSLGLQWQFNGNHSNSWYDFENKGIRLYAVENTQNSISGAANILLQKWAFPEFEAVTAIDIRDLGEDTMAGMMSMGMTYGAVAVKKERDGIKVITIKGEQKFKKEIPSADDIVEYIDTADTDKIYFKNIVSKKGIRENVETENAPLETVILQYSTDGKQYKNALSFDSKAGRWVGVKHGVFCIGKEGSVVADYFHVEGKGR